MTKINEKELKGVIRVITKKKKTAVSTEINGIINRSFHNVEISICSSLGEIQTKNDVDYHITYDGLKVMISSSKEIRHFIKDNDLKFVKRVVKRYDDIGLISMMLCFYYDNLPF
jgi:predicted transcriptional regulator